MEGDWGGTQEKGGWKCMGGGKRGAGSRTPKVETEVGEIAKSTQHCIIFFSRKRAKRQEPSEQTWSGNWN